MDLINSLESVKKGLAGKEIVEQTTSFLFNNKNVIAYNDEICAIAPSPIDIKGAVEAESLLKLLNKTNDKELKIEVKKDELRIKGKNFNTGIKLDKEIRLPIEDVKVPDEFLEVPQNFSQSCKLACLTAAKNSNPADISTYVHFDENRIESCDNDRLTIIDTDTEDADIETLVPATNLLSIAKENIVGVATDDTWMHFKTDEDVILSSRIVNEEYVDLDEHLPDESEASLIQFPQEIKEVLNRADVFSKDSITSERNITVSIQAKKLTISAQNESGWFEETIDIDSKKSFEFTINPEFLRDVLNLSNEVYIVDDMLMFKDDNSTHLIKLDIEDEE